MSSAPNIKRILVPHDFSDTAEYALDYALGIADKFEARVTVLHAYDAPSFGYPDAFVASFEFTSEVERIAAERLGQIAARVRGSSVEIDTLLRRGTAWSEIVAAVEGTKADLIVMGTHGRRGVSRMLLGSVAEKVVRLAPCPVLTVHMTPPSLPSPSHQP